MKLTNVARASLEELRLDYEDFLRQGGLAVWERKDERREELIARRLSTADEVAAWVKDVHDGAREGLGRPDEPGGQSGPGGRVESRNAAGERRTSSSSTPSTSSTQPTFPEIAANAALVLIAVACGLLDRQLAAQADAFENEGGFTERLYHPRQDVRRSQ